MPAATPHRIPDLYINMQVLRITSTLNAVSLCLCHVTMANDECFIFFGQNGLKQLKILALLTSYITISRCKIYKVGMLFCILWPLILCKF